MPREEDPLPSAGTPPAASTICGVTGGFRSVDVAKITCKQFITYEITDARTLSLWLAGYWNGQQKNTVVDVSRFRRRSDALKDYCLSHFDTPLLDAPKTVVETTR